MRRIVLLAFGSLLLTGAAPPSAELPGWLAGCWEQVDGEKWADECWTRPRGGILIGSGRSGHGATLKSWEAMQIVSASDGKVTFWASPNGAARVGFPLVSQGASEIVFANPAHDYPQRVRYWREGELLKAEIALADGSKAIVYTFKRD